MSEKTPKRARKQAAPATRAAPDPGTRLRQALVTTAAAAELRRDDHLRLLEAIVSTAAHVIDASAGSLMLLDEAANELVFQVAVGPGSEQIKQFRVPVGQGIAGFTASTGQALAIADTSQDTRFARQIAEGTGYVPKNLLSVPLLLRGEVIGVMELLDKRGGAATFTPSDTAVLASFGEQAALAIDLSLQSQSLERLLASAAGAAGDATLMEDVRSSVAAAETSPGFVRTIALAAQIAAIGAAGERESQLASAILRAFVEYSGGDPRGNVGPGANFMAGAY